MTDQVLDILKLAFLGLLYLFFARVLWSVWSEVRYDRQIDIRIARSAANAPPAAPAHQPAPSPGAPVDPTPAAPTAPRPTKRDQKRAAKQARKQHIPTELVTLEPKARKGTTVAIAGVVGIGRESDNAIVIADDAFVSTHHARITRTNDGVVITDLGSRNGTFLNGTRLTSPRPVHTGDRVQIGYTLMEAR